MNDGYRYFIVRPTQPDGDPVPVAQSDPHYFRFQEPEFRGLSLPQQAAYYWDGSEWQRSVLGSASAYVNDTLASGATVRELLDEKDVPHA
jgi:hypothetical protein